MSIVTPDSTLSIALRVPLLTDGQSPSLDTSATSFSSISCEPKFSFRDQPAVAYGDNFLFPPTPAPSPRVHYVQFSAYFKCLERAIDSHANQIDNSWNPSCTWNHAKNRSITTPCRHHNGPRKGGHIRQRKYWSHIPFCSQISSATQRSSYSIIRDLLDMLKSMARMGKHPGTTLQTCLFSMTRVATIPRLFRPKGA